MTFPRYEKYKDSGVAWLGEVPEHWRVQSVKTVATCNDDVLEETTAIDYEISYVEISGVDASKGITEISPIAFGNAPSRARRRVKNGDILVSTVRTYLRAIAPVNNPPANMIVSTGFAVIRPSDIESHFLGFIFQAEYLIAEIISHSAGVSYPAINSSELMRLKIPIPQQEEQSAIATFLSRETAKIDELIAEQQRLIELLKEKRQAVISHAVTKGLNPDVPMKDSGIEWLGEVPEEWDVINLNYVLDAIGDVDHYMPESIEKGIPYVMTGDLKEFASNIKFEDCKQVSHKDYLKLSKKIRSSRGDVIMARYATIGTTSYIDVDADFLVSYSCVTIKPNHSKVIGLYLFYYFKSDAFLQGIQNQINTNTQGNVGVNDLKNVKVALPTLTEQTRIIEYLQSKISKLDSISDRSQATIELLKERRTALISAAVTGKIDVRDLV